MEITRHFTATTFIVYEDRVLLHRHKKLGLWLPVGGHIDRDELPEEAAFREVAEEAGVPVQFYAPDGAVDLGGDAEPLLRPARLILEDINPHHQHMDFIYYARATTGELRPDEAETDELRWFTADQLGPLDAPANVKALAREALQLLGERRTDTEDY